ncbi:hypothetical protein SLA2020_471040 [Shorea laevis]
MQLLLMFLVMLETMRVFGIYPTSVTYMYIKQNMHGFPLVWHDILLEQDQSVADDFLIPAISEAMDQDRSQLESHLSLGWSQGCPTDSNSSLFCIIQQPVIIRRTRSKTDLVE